MRCCKGWVFADLLACAFLCTCVCVCVFEFSLLCVRLSEMKAKFGRRALCLNVTLCISFVRRDEVRSRPCASVTHWFSPEGSSLSPSRTAPSTAVLLFQTLFIDPTKKRRRLSHSSLPPF